MSAPGYIARVDRAAVVMHGRLFQFIRKSHAERNMRVSRTKAYGPPRPHGRPRRPDDAKLTAEIASLYNEGLSASEIVERLPQLCFPQAVYRYLKRAGVPTRRFIAKSRSRAAFPFDSAEPAGDSSRVAPAGRLQGASATPIGSRERSRQGASPPSGLRSSRGAR